MPSISVVVRTYNEAPKLRRLLEFLKTQPVEVVVVDNGSTDDTPQLLKEYSVTSVWLDQGQFNYPKSSNLGIAAATGEIIVLMSGHSVPVRRDWVEVVSGHFADPKVGGVYGPPVCEKDSPLFEKVLNWLVYYPALRLRGVRKVTSVRTGVMGATNCAFRRSLWQEHPFDERYGAGGEDGAWAAWLLQSGYTVIFDWRFMVYHSHYLTLRKFLKQLKLWYSLGKPRPFDPEELRFRDDIQRP